MKLYVAGPMTGYEEYNYPAFLEAGRLLEEKGYTVFNPAHNDDKHDEERFSQSYSWYMREDFRMILDSDGIALLPGWEKSTGAGREVQLAKWLELDVRLVSEWLEEEGK